MTENDIRKWTPELLEQTLNIAHGDVLPHGPLDSAPEPSFTLRTPEQLRVLEADWHAIYSPGKPFSIDQVPRQAEFPWDSEDEDVWMGFLDRHPEAFGSIDLLDDPRGLAVGSLGPLSADRLAPGKFVQAPRRRCTRTGRAV